VPPPTRIRIAQSQTLDLFMALQREVFGRMSWEVCLLDRPHRPEVAGFIDGLRRLRAAGVNILPHDVAKAATPGALADLANNGADSEGWISVAHSVTALKKDLLSAIQQNIGTAEKEISHVKDTFRTNERRYVDALLAALGSADPGLDLPIYLVPFVSFPPGSSFLGDGGQIGAGYVDYRRFSGPALLECIVLLVGWALLAAAPSEALLMRQLSAGLAGTGNNVRRLRALTLRMLISLTAEHMVADSEPGYHGITDLFGTNLRYRRLYETVVSPWRHYLNGHTSRGKAITLIADRLGKQPPEWFIEQIDAASIAADYYLLEWMATNTDEVAASMLAYWEPRLADEFAWHLDLAVGAELCHYDGFRTPTLPPPLREFMQRVCDGNGMLLWPAARRELGPQAYELAEEVFAGPGAHRGGGPPWAPIARAVSQFSSGGMPARVFIDKCFSLEHNNGCCFDKFFDTSSMLDILDGQARGDIDFLAANASEEVRRLLCRHQVLARQDSGRRWTGAWPPEPAPAGHLGMPATDRAEWESLYGWTAGGPPRIGGRGRAGCGSKQAVNEQGDSDSPAVSPAVWRNKPRRRRLLQVPHWQSADATVHTSLGPIELSLFPHAAPMAVGVFVQLARGEMEWLDPLTGSPGSGPFYDGTPIHRVIPDFLIQAGDRTGTGIGGAGFRFDEEDSQFRFDEPYRVAMFNRGLGTSGSQFFITLAPASHLDGQYTIIGTVRDELSRQVAHRLSRSRDAGRGLCITSIDVTAVAS
jgi:cyclophilin family peptidyl-prolyl cis-trans isomerase